MPALPKPVTRAVQDQLNVEVYRDRQELGSAAGRDVAERMRSLLARKGQIRIMFASAPSQNEFVQSLGSQSGIDWSRVMAFHMDGYAGMNPDDPNSFSRYLRDRLFNRVTPAVFHEIDSAATDLEAECARYARLLTEAPLDILCLGIGENGHVAFNDPPVADFEDPRVVKLVELELKCRQQQVNDGWYPHINAVPRLAITVTVPGLMSAKHAFCMVPGPTKAEAVRNTLLGPISTACPATALRRHPSATLYLDADSAALYPGG